MAEASEVIFEPVMAEPTRHPSPCEAALIA
jgi:hypothetical protein